MLSRNSILPVIVLAALALPAHADNYVNYVCAVDGYGFDIARESAAAALLRDADHKVIKVERKAASVGERYIGKTADGQTLDVWMKDAAAVIDTGPVRHNACWIARFAQLGAANYVCSNGYRFATHVTQAGKMEYIDGLGNSAPLAQTAARNTISYHGATPAGLTLDLTIAQNTATLTSSGGAKDLACTRH